jgi:hypothetical protein
MKMPKRFTDTDIWEKEWFMSLKPTEKCLVKYVRDKCDLAGIWKPNYMLASYVIGEKVTEEMLISIDNGKQFQKLNDDKILCIDFVRFQYGSQLNPTSPIHRKVIDLLSRYDIEPDTKEVQQKGFNKPTIEDIKAEMMNKWDEKNATYQANRFYDYYESNGWFVGKNKMKSWRHAVSGWMARTKIEPTQESIAHKLELLGNKKFSEL